MADPPSDARSPGSTCTDELKVERLRSALHADEAAELAEILRALGDATRVKIAWALSQDELCVSELTLLLDLPQPTISNSLRKLFALKLVRLRKVRQVAYYSLDEKYIRELLNGGFKYVEGAR